MRAHDIRKLVMLRALGRWRVDDEFYSSISGGMIEQLSMAGHFGNHDLVVETSRKEVGVNAGRARLTRLKGREKAPVSFFGSGGTFIRGFVAISIDGNFRLDSRVMVPKSTTGMGRVLSVRIRSFAVCFCGFDFVH